MKTWKNYFYYSRSERNATTVLAVLCMLLLALPYCYRFFIPQQKVDFSEFEKAAKQLEQINEIAIAQSLPALFSFDPNSAKATELLALGIPERTVNTIISYRNKGGVFRKKEDLKKIYGLKLQDYQRLEPFIVISLKAQKVPGTEKRNALQQQVEPGTPFPFNPNTAKQTELEALGLPEKIARRIIRYREKGGSFRQGEDLRKIYGLDPSDYQRLKPFIRISEQQDRETGPAPTAAATPEWIDINRATAEDWQQIRGIGTYRSEKIVGFREKLGGFSSIDQVGETYGLPDSLFRKIRPMLKASPVFRKININQAGAEALSAHPYLNWKQARVIVSYRQQHGPFTSVAALEKVRVLDEASMERIKPYLDLPEETGKK